MYRPASKVWLEVMNSHPDIQIVDQYEGDWQASSGYLCTHKSLCDGRAFNYVLVGREQVALGVSKALSEFNLSIPQEVSVIGFDDSAYFSPPLTTIRQDFLTIGQRADLLAITMPYQGTEICHHESIAI